ncbi:MAG: hypothetical protein N3I86_11850 [Verrucomicrobiae bacterium]|nr:hypothetical protein [Verrucomicrobiae bacterium]MDW8307853.1 hypothetical protein [Verrucomicrobiales bacterium]
MNGTSPNGNARVSWPTILAVVGACLVFLALVGQLKKHTLPPPPVDAARRAERAKALAELRAAEAEALQNPGWIDPAKGLVRLPIDVALQLTEREWQNPAQARSNLIARVEKATFVPPPPPAKPSEFE